MPNCGKQEKEKNVEDMTFDEIKEKTLSSIEKKNNEIAIENLEKLIAIHPDNQNISKYKLMLANLYFDTGNLPSAYQMYEHFKEFYPSDSNVEFATYRAILSKFYQILKIDCDQTHTQATINLCENYLNHFPYQVYRNDIKDIQRTCEHKLIDKEVYVYNFYLKKGKFDAAQKRLQFLQDNYLAKNPTLEARLLFLECKLAEKQKKQDMLNAKLEKLFNKYPDSYFTKMAERLNTKNTFIF